MVIDIPHERRDAFYGKHSDFHQVHGQSCDLSLYQTLDHLVDPTGLTLLSGAPMVMPRKRSGGVILGLELVNTTGREPWPFFNLERGWATRVRHLPYLDYHFAPDMQPPGKLVRLVQTRISLGSWLWLGKARRPRQWIVNHIHCLMQCWTHFGLRHDSDTCVARWSPRAIALYCKDYSRGSQIDKIFNFTILISLILRKCCSHIINCYHFRSWYFYSSFSVLFLKTGIQTGQSTTMKCY